MIYSSGEKGLIEQNISYIVAFLKYVRKFDRSKVFQMEWLSLMDNLSIK